MLLLAMIIQTHPVIKLVYESHHTSYIAWKGDPWGCRHVLSAATMICCHIVRTTSEDLSKGLSQDMGYI